MPNFYESVKTFFRFYKSIDQQSRYSNVCDDTIEHEYLIMYRDLLPFQIVRPHSAAAISHLVKLYCLNDTEEDDLSHEMVADFTDNISVEINGELFDFISYSPTSHAYTIPAGRYYITFSDGTSTWYSEIFEMMDDEALTREKDYFTDTFWTDYLHAEDTDTNMSYLAAGRLT